MRIGIIMRGFMQGGVAKIVMHLLPLFKKAGYEVVIFSSFPQEEDMFANVPDHARVVIGEDSHRSENLKRAIKAEGVELCILEDAWVGHLPADCAALKEVNIPHIIHFHSVFSELFLLPEPWRDERALYDACIHADAVIALSKCDEYYFRLIGCNAHYFMNPLEVLPAEFERVEEPFSILWVGRIECQKNPRDAVYILEKVLRRFPQATLTMVGRTDSSEADAILREIHTKPHLQKAVKLPGFTNNVWEYYSKASLFLSTSSHEGFPCTFMEAGAAEMPIVGYDLPYLEAVRDNSGFVPVKMGDVDAAAEAICNLFADREACIRAGKANRAVFEKLSSFDQMAAYGKLFEEVKKGIRAEPPIEDEIAQVCLKTLIEHATLGIEGLKNELAVSRKRMKRMKWVKRWENRVIVALILLLLLLGLYSIV